MSYRAIDVADHIVSYCLETGKGITHLHLQKILYYLEAKFMVANNGEQLFVDPISKWKLGPVVESVYDEYKIFGSRQIAYVPGHLDVSTGRVQFLTFDPNSIDTQDKDFINAVVDIYAEENPFDLVNATHRHELWLRDEIKINSGEKIDYDKQEIKEFFEEDSSHFEI